VVEQAPEPTDIILRELRGTVTELHALPMPTEGDTTEVWVMRPTTAAVAMGSSQQPEQFDLQRLNADKIELAPRRSGGGAVFIDPTTTVWIDVLAPRSSPLWSPQLSENFLIVGRLWRRALTTLGIDTELCDASPVRTAAATVACWAGSGWGELLVGPAKTVGLSQRRTRWGSRVQSMAVVDGSSARISDYLLAEQRSLVTAAIPTQDLGITTSALEAAVVDVLGVKSGGPR